jgi:uncharacterized protein
MSTIETRYATELRVAPGDEMVLQGYAATFNSLSKDLGGFREMIAPGAFTRALAEKQDVRCLFNHSADKVLGRTAAGTLVLAQDEKGLSFRCQLDPKQTAHRDLHASVARGDINECSFAFSPNGDSGDAWENRKDADGSWYIARTLKDVNLFDVSAVTHPAYNGTTVAARAEVVPMEIRSIISKLVEKRARAEKRDNDDSLEDYIREVGQALHKKFPRDTTGDCAPACGYGKYWICETYPDYIIANDESQMDGYVRIPYVEDGDDNYVFGTPVPVEKEWVPSERCAKVATENRSVVAEHLKAIAAAHAGTAGDHQGAAAAHTDAADTHAAAAAAISAAADKQDKEDKKAAKEAEEAAAAAKAAEQRDEDDDEESEDEDPDPTDDGERSTAPVTPMTPEEIEEMDLRFRLSIAAPDANPGFRYSDDQPRDKDGKFGSGGSGGASKGDSGVQTTPHRGNMGTTSNHDQGFAPGVKGNAGVQYHTAKHTALEAIDRIKDAINKMDSNPDKHWGHVGTLGEHAQTLSGIADSLHGTGEYARSADEPTAEVRYSDDQPRDDHGRWGGGDSIGKTSSGKDIPAANHKVYNEAQKMPKYNGKVSPANAHGRDGGKMLKQRLPEFTKQDHLEASKAHTEAAAAQEKTWNTEADKAAQETFGRPFQIGDYKISGIGSDKFSEASKDKLREAAHTATDHKEAALAHWHAAGKHGRP